MLLGYYLSNLTQKRTLLPTTNLHAEYVAGLKREMQPCMIFRYRFTSPGAETVGVIPKVQAKLFATRVTPNNSPPFIALVSPVCCFLLFLNAHVVF